MIYSLVDWTLGDDIGRQQPISSHIGAGPAGLLEQFGAKPVASGRCCTVLWELRLWGICQMMWRHMVKHHQTANKIERWWEMSKTWSNDWATKWIKMLRAVRNCDLCFEKLEASGLLQNHTHSRFLYILLHCRARLPGDVPRTQNLDHFGPFGTYLDYYQRVGLGPTGCQWGFAETCVASHCGWVAGAPRCRVSLRRYVETP